jgi:TonB family protein
LVQARAAQSKADKLPELQVLLLEEFGMVGLSKPPENEGLQLGAVFDESWKLIGIEKTKPPFYVFEKVPLTQAKAHEQMMERQSQKTFDPSEVIETIVVPDPQPPQPQPQPNQAAQPRATRPRTVTAAHNRPAPTPEDEEDGVGKSAFAGPRMLTSHLPAYTEQALAKGVEGELIVAALFRRDGRIEGITVVKGLGYGLDEHAVEAVERLDFAPARLAEQAVDARAEIVYTFTLSKVSVRFRNVAAQ